MGLKGILAEIDVEIGKLEQAPALLIIGATRGRGRPKSLASAGKPAQKKRDLSPEGRRRIAENQRRRSAAKEKASGK
jgi:hypothetical protein